MNNTESKVSCRKGEKHFLLIFLFTKISKDSSSAFNCDDYPRNKLTFARYSLAPWAEDEDGTNESSTKQLGKEKRDNCDS